MKIFLLAIYLYSFSLLAASVAPNDDSYHIYKTDKFTIISAEEYKKLIPYLMEEFNDIFFTYSKEFNWNFVNPPIIIISSSKNQIANAYATIVPYIKSVYYSGSSPHIDMFSEASWLKGLIVHETSHLYQLDVKSQFPRKISEVFGNIQFFSPVFPIWTFVNPNIALPKWIIEGNAVLNESRFNNGGRLFSGEQKALFYTLIKNNLITKERLINCHLNFPYGSEKYIVGGYINYFLAQKYGIQKINRFFLEHAKHYFNPLILNKTFKQHFNRSMYSLLDEFLQIYKDKSNNHTPINLSPLFTSKSLIPITKHQDKLLILLDKDIKSYPTIVEFNTTNLNFTQKAVNLKKGKPFYYKNRLHSSANGLINLSEIRYSLWNESANYQERFLNKYILDIQKNDLLYFNTVDSYHSPLLYKNEQLIGKVNSNAMFDSSNDVYYFKQVDKKRLLFKNHTKIFELNGYYGKLADILNEDVFFIANTQYGSSLFKYSDNTVYQAHNSDAIVDAKILPNNQALIAEVTPNGYEYKVINLQYKKQRPFEDVYFFEEKKNKPKIKQPKYTQGKYSPLSHLSFSYFNPSIILGIDFQIYNASMLWADPLGYFRLTSNIYFSSIDNNFNTSMTFLSTKNITNWGMNTTYNKEPEDDQTTLDLSLVASRPLKKINDYLLSANMSLGRSIIYEPGMIYSLTFNFTKQKQYSLSLFPYRLIQFLNKSSFNEYNDSTYNNFTFNFIYDLGKENILSLNTQYHFMNNDDLKIKNTTSLAEIPTANYIFLNNKSMHLAVLSGSFKKVVNKSFYNHIFPLSLRRFAPELFTSYIKNITDKDLSIVEYGINISFEFLFAHSYPFVAEVKGIKSISLNNSFSSFLLNLKKEF